MCVALRETFDIVYNNCSTILSVDVQARGVTWWLYGLPELLQPALDTWRGLLASKSRCSRLIRWRPLASVAPARSIGSRYSRSSPRAYILAPSPLWRSHKVIHSPRKYCGASVHVRIRIPRFFLHNLMGFEWIFILTYIWCRRNSHSSTINANGKFWICPFYIVSRWIDSLENWRL